MAEDLENAVLAAEKQRCSAMLTNDVGSLAALLDPRLHFAHATGAVDSKDSYLAKMGAGRIRYLGIAWSEEQITALAPDAAILTGRMTTDVQVEGSDKQLNNRVITVWKRSDGEWQLLAFQSTPLAA